MVVSGLDVSSYVGSCAKDGIPDASSVYTGDNRIHAWEYSDFSGQPLPLSLVI